MKTPALASVAQAAEIVAALTVFLRQGWLTLQYAYFQN